MSHWVKGAVLATTACALIGALGCSSSPSMSSIVNELKAPTGTVDATSAKQIGTKLEEQLKGSSGLNGEREDLRSKIQAQSAACPNGGSLDASSSGDQNNGYVHGNYNNCCLTEDCCFNGAVDIFYDSSNADFTTCFDYDLGFNCGVDTGSGIVNSSGNLDLAACISGSGTTAGYVYLIEIENLSYRVTGSISGGSGSIEVTGVNGTFNCTYTSGSGSCTGTAGTFTF